MFSTQKGTENTEDVFIEFTSLVKLICVLAEEEKR